MAPAAGAKFIGSVPPITLISHRFECQMRRFFAILRDGPARYGEGASGGGIDGAVTTQRIGRPDSAPAGGRGQGSWPREGFFVWFYLTILINRIEKLNILGAFYRLLSPEWALSGLHGPESGGRPGFPGMPGICVARGRGHLAGSAIGARGRLGYSPAPTR